MNYDPNRRIPMATVLGVAWVTFAGGMLVAALLAVVTRPTITVVSTAKATTTTAAVEIAAPATTVRRATTTAKPTTTTTEAPPTTRYVPPTTRYVPPPTIDESMDEDVQRLALEMALDQSDMTVSDLCLAIDTLGMDQSVDSFLEGANEGAMPGDPTFDRWIVEDYFAEQCS